MGIVASRILCSTCPHQNTQTSFPANGSTHRIVSPFASGVHTLCSSAVGGKSTRWRIDAAGLLRQHTSSATVANLHRLAGRSHIFSHFIVRGPIIPMSSAPNPTNKLSAATTYVLVCSITSIASLAGFREFWIVRCPWRVLHYE